MRRLVDGRGASDERAHVGGVDRERIRGIRALRILPREELHRSSARGQELARRRRVSDLVWYA